MPRHRFQCVIDPGHGGQRDQDPLRISPRHHIYEGDVNLRVARRLVEILSRAPNIQAHLTRTEDVYVPLARRVQIAEDLGVDIFVSVHHNMTSIETAGFHHPIVFVHAPYDLVPSATRDLARGCLREFKSCFAAAAKISVPPAYPESGLISDQTIFAAGMRLLRDLDDRAPAIITEAYFLSDSIFENLASRDELIEAEARAIAAAIGAAVADKKCAARAAWSPVTVAPLDSTRLEISGAVTWEDGPAVRDALSAEGVRPRLVGLADRAGARPRARGGAAGARVECVASHNTLNYVCRLTIAEFLAARGLVLDAPADVLLHPDCRPLAFPFLRPHFAWSSLWTDEVDRAARAARPRPYPAYIADQAKLSLALFVNHPYRVEAMLLAAEQAALGGDVIGLAGFLTPLARVRQLNTGADRPPAWLARLESLERRAKRPAQTRA